MYDEKKIFEEIEEKRKDLQQAKLDMTFQELGMMYEEKELIINPKFMELYNWNEYQKTRLIESILIGVNIPPAYVVENGAGTWELVDGLQRLCTVLSFMGKFGEQYKWTLTQGDILKNIEGQNFDDLPLKAKTAIKRYFCRVEIIYYDKEYIRGEMYKRFNTSRTQIPEEKIEEVLKEIITVK